MAAIPFILNYRRSIISRSSQPNQILRRMSSTSPSASDSTSEAPPAGPKVVVLGGSGYVGSHVLQAVLNRGADAVSINRSGKPKAASGSWVSQVKWVPGDVFESSRWSQELEGANGVVSCIGAFGSEAFMEKINGDANIHAIETAAKAGVKNFVYVSTVENNLPNFVLRGYFHGKKRAEEALLEKFPSGGYILRPSFVYGTRQVGNVNLPLGLLGKPMEVLFRLPPFPSLRTALPGGLAILAPPVAVEAVASVAAAAALSGSEGEAQEKIKPGILTVDEIVKLARGG